LENKEFFITFQPKGKKVKVLTGTSLVEAAQKAKINMPSFCGSRGKCGKCKVKILLPQLTYTEQEKNPN